MRELLKTSYKSGAIYPGEDQWAAVVNADGMKDLIQVGDGAGLIPAGTSYDEKYNKYASP